MQVAATKRTELLTTAASMEELRWLAEAGADAFVVGESRYAVRMAGEFDLATIRSAVAFAKPRGVRRSTTPRLRPSSAGGAAPSTPIHSHGIAGAAASKRVRTPSSAASRPCPAAWPNQSSAAPD